MTHRRSELERADPFAGGKTKGGKGDGEEKKKGKSDRVALTEGPCKFSERAENKLAIREP